ncbi:MAG: branched-chain amino acid ABC transporter substrate-binding protein, partial [Candidatus Binatia bacterium]
MKKILMGKDFSRRMLLKQAALTGAGLGAFSLNRNFEIVPSAFAESHPAIGTYPAGSSGSTVAIGASVPRTGAYAVQGEDELKGMQLAVEH